MEIKLNLIPPYRKTEIEQSAKLRKILSWETEIFAIVLIFFGLVLSLNYILQFNLDAVTSASENQRGNDGYERIYQYDNDFKAINVKVSLDESLQKDQLYWSETLRKLNETMPDKVVIVKMASNNYKFFLAGVADTRDDLIAFKDRLSQENCFINVNLPLSNLVEKNNVAFQLDFVIKEECLKHK